MIKIVCVGIIKEKYLKEMIYDYEKRLTKYHKVQIIELKDSNIKEEKNEILKNIFSQDYIICMCLEGKQFTSRNLANHINELFINGKSSITFIIGGSDGIDEEIKRISNEKISFSSLTFPHGIFRALLLEQLYRSFKILNNEKYDK